MYNLIYKATSGSQGDKDVKEYSVWLEEEPTAEEKEELIRELEETGELPKEVENKDCSKRYENFQHTVMLLNNDKPEVVYKRKTAKEISFYSDGTYSVNEGESHNFNDDYFHIGLPELKEKMEDNE